MANLLRGYEISKPSPNKSLQAASTQPPSTVPSSIPTAEPDAWPPIAARPLSDIRELTEPSLIDVVAFQRSAGRFQHKRSTSKGSSTAQDRCVRRKESTKGLGSMARNVNNVPSPVRQGTSSSYSTTPEHPGFYMIPSSSVPRRSSSQQAARAQSFELPRKPSIRIVPPPPPPAGACNTHDLMNRGCSQSPVKELGLRLDPVTADRTRNVPMQTYVREPSPYDVLEYPTYKHPRVRLDIQVSGPMFVGGGTVEGFVKVTVDDNERMKQRRSLGIGTISVDLIGYEEIASARRAIFMALGTDLVDTRHPPPTMMVEPAKSLALDDRFWTLSPSTSMLPFMITLPLDTGPPPFESKQARIRFVLYATALIRDASKHYRVRTSQEVYVLPTYDPEKALISLPSPLIASDELPLPRSGGYESIQITAGLHRQVWVSGSSIFADVHISNKSRKLVKKLDLSLECNVLCYKHTAATTREKSAGQARIFESKHQTMLGMSSLKAGTNGWSGVEPHSSQTRTCDLELSRGHATVRCGKYFEVRYFVNVTASISNTKLVSVQLPIILVHMNSLDVVPNSVAQVAAAIEEKRGRVQHHDVRRHRRRRTSETHPANRTIPTRQQSISSPVARTADRDIRRQPSYTQGRAFAAPRQQSLERQRANQANLNDLQHALDSSPRKYQPPPPSILRGFALRKKGSNLSFGRLQFATADSTTTSSTSTPEKISTFRGMTYRTPECQQRNKENHRMAVPPPQHHQHQTQYDTSKRKEKPCLRDRLRRVGSLDSFHHHFSKRAVPPPPPPAHAFSISRPSRAPSAAAALYRRLSDTAPPPPPSRVGTLAPHTLGLSATTAVNREHRPNTGGRGLVISSGLQGGGGGGGGISSSTSMTSSREKLDRSRVEFRAVGRKGSQSSHGISGGGGELVDRGVRWRESEERPEREGWI